MEHTDVRAWTDLDPHSRFRNKSPNVIIKAAEIASGEYDSFLGDDFKPGHTRRVVYKDSSVSPPEHYVYEMILFVKPGGSGTLTIHTGSASTSKGKLMGEDGAYTGDREDTIDIAGGMLTNYCVTTSFVGSSVSQQPVWETSFEVGDAIWLVRKGRYEVLVHDTVAVDLPVVTAATAGTVDHSTTTFSATVTLGEIREQVTGVTGLCVGRCITASTGGAGTYGVIQLELPDRYDI